MRSSRRGREGGARPHSQTGPKQSYCICVCCPNSVSSTLLPAPSPCSPLVTSSNATVTARRAFCPPLPRLDYSCCPCEHLATVGTCDWVLPPLPLPLFLSGPLSLLFFLVWGAPSAVAFLPLPLHLLPRAGADISRKLVPSVSSP